ncbi:MAG: TIGR02530 family flagellar biosynthesis protein [Bacillota bacterium]|nr:TIGR02530 family flagellar biosynthesis protein [Bacillota bacterium]
MDNNIISSKKIEAFLNATRNQQKPKTEGNEFDKMLKSKLKVKGDEKEITFSKHSMERLQKRNINLNEEDIKKLGNAFEKAEEKNIKTPLIVSDNLICVADTKTRTIITVMDTMKDKVFTNVDGVVNI